MLLLVIRLDSVSGRIHIFDSTTPSPGTTQAPRNSSCKSVSLMSGPGVRTKHLLDVFAAQVQLGFRSQPGNDLSWFLWRVKATFIKGFLEAGVVLVGHDALARVPNDFLHVRVDTARPDGHRCHIGLLDGKMLA